MKFQVIQMIQKSERLRRLVAASLTLVYACGIVTQAAAQKIASPAMPDLITPPAGNSAPTNNHSSRAERQGCARGVAPTNAPSRSHPELARHRAIQKNNASAHF